MAFAIRAAVVTGAALWLAGWLLQRQHAWRYGAHSLPADLNELLTGGPVGRGIAPAVGYIAGLFAGAAPGWARSSVDTLLARAPWHPPPVPVFVAWVALFAMGAGIVSAAYDTRRLEKEPRALKARGRTIAFRIFGGVILWAIFILVVLVGALILDSRPIPAGLAGFLGMPSARLLLAVCMLWTLILALTPVPEPAQVHGAESPERVLRLDRRASVIPAVVRRTCGLALAWLCFGPFAAAAYGLYAVVRLLCQVFLGSAHTASGRFADTRIWLAGRRRMPLRPMAFLSDAHERGVLRQTGAAYQFRHLRLQQHLAAQHPRWAPRLASAAVGVTRRFPARYPATVVRRWPLPDAAWAGPVWTLLFDRAAAKLSGIAEVGTPVGDALHVGPGFAREYRSAGQDQWMMCALPGRAPVLVARPVWDAVEQVPGASEDAFSEFGYPVANIPGDPGQPSMVPADAGRVRMEGGARGPGVLVNDTTRGAWRWEAAESYRCPSPGDGTGSGGQSRILVAATIPWLAQGLTITDEARLRFLESLPGSTLAGAIAQLSAPAAAGAEEARRPQPPAGEWQAHGGGVRNWGRYAWAAVPGTDGGPAATAELDLSLRPGAYLTTVTTRVELRIENFHSWRGFRPGAGPCAGGARPRIPLQELVAFLAAAWHMVAEALPGIVVSDPVSVPLGGAPVVTWELWACGHGARADGLCLHDVVDWAPLAGGGPARRPAGVPGRRPRAGTCAPAGPPQLTAMGIAITGPLRHSEDDRRRRSWVAFEEMAQWHGLRRPTGSGSPGLPAVTDGLGRATGTPPLSPP